MIMKTEKFFELGFVPENMPHAVHLYCDCFFKLFDELIEVEFDMCNRYGLYLAEQEGLLSEEQIIKIHIRDKQYLQNFRKGLYRADYWLQIDEMAEFFDWLSDYVYEEDEKRRKLINKDDIREKENSIVNGMKEYKNRAGNSGIISYDYGLDWIHVQFEDGDVYEYNYEVTGELDVEEMKRLADHGVGLNSFINRFVRNYYSRKVSEGKNTGFSRRSRMGEVELALGLFTSLKGINSHWSSDKVMEIFSCLDRNYDFEGLDTTPIRKALFEHKYQILYEEDTLKEIKYYREENKIARTRFWWYIDEVIFEEIKVRFKNIDREFRFGELFSDFDFLDKNAIILNSKQSEELKILLVGKKKYILWCDKEAMIRYRENEDIPRSRFWWWLDELE